MQKTCTAFKIYLLLILNVLLNTTLVNAQNQHKTEIPFDKDEFWWGGVVAYGSQMPYIKPVKEFNLGLQHNNNQVVPLFVSNKGRYIWSDKPFKFEINDNTLSVRSDFEKINIQQAGNTLKSAYLDAIKNHLPPNGKIPKDIFFSKPQYNTWIELMYNQNQKDIEKYAQAIVDNNFPTGIIMIDDNWQRYYGNFDFRAEKFADAKAMISKLHKQGFQVMVWVCPFVSSDSPEYRELEKKGFLIKNKNSNTPALIQWWNGQSACYDLTNPKAFDHYVAQLKKVQDEYGVDGFKFDAGDNSFYDERILDSYKKDAISVDHTSAWQKLGEIFPYNEYRAGWKGGGTPLVERLGDKNYSWKAVQDLIPEMLTAGLLGYAYTCPDMIGGGQWNTFLNIKEDQFNQPLIVRSAQVHAMMPMMQFSVAPWRILSKENLEHTRQAALLHEKMGPYILELAHHASKTGEPIVRHMEYAYPNQGYATCIDQFMLGDKYLVAPVVNDKLEREVKLPKGSKWKDDLGKVYKGGQTYKINVPLSRLPYFEKIK